MVMFDQQMTTALRAVFLYFATLLVMVAGTDPVDSPGLDGGGIFYAALAAAMVVAPELFTSGATTTSNDQNRTNGPSPHQRQRKKVRKLMEELGEINTRRTYRMTEKSFWTLFDLLSPIAPDSRNPGHHSTKKHRNGAPNGIIDFDVRLSAALQYFAGGQVSDISVLHGISRTEVMRSVWIVVDAVNQCSHLDISFPNAHDEQMKLAQEFKTHSNIQFDCCVAALGDILIRLTKSAIKERQEQMKIVRGGKEKYGLNMQAACDAQCRFLDVSIDTSGPALDFASLRMSKFQRMIETPNFLAPGLCVFGNAAYNNSMSLAAPFNAVSDETKDAYNFLHSQLQNKIECAFGMLAQRWAILRMAISSKISIDKTKSLLHCLCKLHNFCIDMREAVAPENMPDVELNICTCYEAGVRLDHNLLPISPSHTRTFDDIPRNLRRQLEQSEQNLSTMPEMPCNKMLQRVIDSGMVRPKPIAVPAMDGP